jgi:uncharacterized protein (TIGR02246 family)
MRTLLLLFCLLLNPFLAPPPAASPAPAQNDRDAILDLADRIFAAARSRDAKQFASFFSDDPPCIYLINQRVLHTRAVVERTFAAMLERQSVFDPQWGERSVQLLTPTAAVLTGSFTTAARRVTGEAWQATGAVTFVAIRRGDDWQVVNWHTSE